MIRKRTHILFVIPLMFFLVLISSPSARASYGLRLETCFNQELGEEVICGTYEVMENRQVRKGAKIRLNFIILPARSASPEPDPVFILDGGPGAAAASSPAAWARYCRIAREDRDIVLLDQRGTGRSHPLPCSRIGDQESAQTWLQTMFPADYVLECRRELRRRAALDYYDSQTAMADLDDLRAALGYESINIMGGSYGSYFGQIYMKLYPDRVRSAFLFSIAMPHLLYPAHLARDTQRALERLFTACAADPVSAVDYPDLAARLNRVLARLKRTDVIVDIQNPINGRAESVNFSWHNFSLGLRAMLYSNSASRWIPAFIHWADAGVYAPIAEYTVDYNYWSQRNIMDGMFLCVTCTETIPFIDFEAARQEAQGTMMGDYRLVQQQNACQLWGLRQVPAEFLDPVTADIPTLIVNGENDPTTPPENARLLSQYLGNSAVVVIPNAGHEIGPVMDGCLDEKIAQFFRQASAAGINFSCVYTYTRPPFVSWRAYNSENMDRIREDFKGDWKSARSLRHKPERKNR